MSGKPGLLTTFASSSLCCCELLLLKLESFHALNQLSAPDGEASPGITPLLPAVLPYKTLSVYFAAFLVTLRVAVCCPGVCMRIFHNCGKWRGREFVPGAQFSAFNKSLAVLLLVK